MSLLCLNTQSIRNKTSLMNAYLVDKSIDVLCFTEHWFTEEEINPLFLDNYKIVTCFPRKTMSGGGTMILTKRNIKSIPLLRINKLSLEYQCEVSAIYIKEIDLIVLCLYRSPAASFATFLDHLHNILETIDISKNIMVCGDFNVKFNLQENDSRELVNIFESLNLFSS